MQNMMACVYVLQLVNKGAYAIFPNLTMFSTLVTFGTIVAD